MNILVTVILIVAIALISVIWFRYAPIEIFAMLVAFKPDNPEGWFELGKILYAKGRYAGAFDCFDKAKMLAIDGPDIDAFIQEIDDIMASGFKEFDLGDGQ